MNPDNHKYRKLIKSKRIVLRKTA
ncbi:AURKAIP1/COX24 domain-containing protein [Vibrio cyclitrophicus]|nr:AURKAIP1/COX24 domain-containing protein [Vibrio cyclitrophicus]